VNHVGFKPVREKHARLIQIVDFDHYHPMDNCGRCQRILAEYYVKDDLLPEYMNLGEYFMGYEFVVLHETKDKLYVLAMDPEHHLVLYIFERED
jgi:hypothetical protein